MDDHHDKLLDSLEHLRDTNEREAFDLALKIRKLSFLTEYAALIDTHVREHDDRVLPSECPECTAAASRVAHVILP